MKLWVDDIRVPPDSSWTWVKNYADAIQALLNHEWEEMSLDHDLGLEHYYGEYRGDTGYDILLFMASQVEIYGKKYTNNIHVHSANPVGVERMKGVIERYLK